MRHLFYLLSVLAILCGSLVHAGSPATDNMTVTVNFTPTCNITAGNGSFGNIDSVMSAGQQPRSRAARH